MRIVRCGVFAALFWISGLTHAGLPPAVAVPGQGTWETTLLGRDINGHAIAATDPGAVFAYDTVLDATWYLTGNNSYFFNQTWDDAMNWAAGLTVGTFSGWSLPKADSSCFAYDCTSSQMGELYYTALGNRAGGRLTNGGPFKNLVNWVYWSGTELPSYTPFVMIFFTSEGYQRADAKSYNFYALAIRPGDVLSAVPEPETYAMLLAGLFGVVVLRRRSLPSMGRLFPMLA